MMTWLIATSLRLRIIVLVLAAAIIGAIVLCKPLGLCWEREPPAEMR